MFRRCLLLFSLRPSTLRVRVPRVGLCDDSRNVNKALKSIRKQLGPLRRLDGRPSGDSSRDTSENSSMHTPNSETDLDGNCTLATLPDSTCTTTIASTNHSNIPDTASTAHRANTSDRALRLAINSRNRYHRNLWIAMKKRDSLSFDRTCQQLRNSGLGLDAVSYALMINGTLMFSKSSDMDQALGMVEEMKEAGIHPSFIRFLSRLISLYLEMCYYNTRPLISNWLSVTRSSWLTAYLITIKNR
ncbi:conserved hypothetical protein [Theileria orientalis strain Shintoku]|uniref:Pentatricopeptide repeat containing protein n=1 Tax=Theileria orientalis strain Shintoku TaxID=869250 RepID=J4C7I8_THEOR|nr:conserved hypothetical protein [Theileria orientalis strain Shintoku]BAM39113.1 conserved hypothetical protein [Theileria orientalis strain Shintoku]|eukprot:XP_009689414.1 conserved hypothetical protein [Theileria orientalis strain Shintoku]